MRLRLLVTGWTPLKLKPEPRNRSAGALVGPIFPSSPHSFPLGVRFGGGGGGDWLLQAPTSPGNVVMNPSLPSWKPRAASGSSGLSSHGRSLPLWLGKNPGVGKPGPPVSGLHFLRMTRLCF